MKGKSDTILVSFDYTHGDIPVLIVGRKGTREIDIINAFKGEEAKELYQKLTIMPPPKIDTIQRKGIDAITDAKIRKIEKVISLLKKWRCDVSSIGNETAFSDDILQQAVKEFSEIEL